MQVDGSCHCGKIAYRAEVNPEKTSLCHCTDCQVLSGSPYRSSVPASAEAFVLLSGQPKVYVKTAESGAWRAQAFCADCGTPIYATSVAEPKIYFLRMGSIRQRAQLPPRRQIWCRSALPWSAYRRWSASRAASSVAQQQPERLVI